MRARLALLALLSGACGARDFRALEPLPEGTEYKLAVAHDGVAVGGALLRASDPTRLEVQEQLELGRALDVWLFPFTRAELDAAIPGGAGADEASLLAGVRPVLESEGDGSIPLPQSVVVLETRVEDGGPTELSFTTTPRSAWAEKTRDIPLGVEVDEALACGAVRVEHIPLESDVFPRAVAVASRDRAFIAARSTLATHLILELGPMGVRSTTVAGLGSPTESFSWDAATETLWGLDVNLRAYRIKPNGAPQAFPPLPPAASPVVELAAGRDGTVVALAYSGLNVPTFVLPPRASDWTTVEDFTNTTVSQLRVARLNRYAIYGNCWGYSWDLDPNFSPPRRHWSVEAAGDGTCMSPPTALAIDDSQYLWIGRNKDLKRGTEQGAAWPAFAHGIEITRDNQWPRALAAMGDGRFAVAGERGQLEVWVGNRWCIPPATAGVTWEYGAGADGAAVFVTSQHAIRVTID